MSMTVLRAMGVVCLAVTLRAQVPGLSSAAGFEVASIKPAKAGQQGSAMRPGKGSITLSNFTLRQMILYAWDLRDHQVSGGPGWVETQGFDVSAKIERRPGSVVKMELLMQKLLEERFQLKMHPELRDGSVYALVVGRDGTRIPDSASGVGQGKSVGNGFLKSRGMTMASLAQSLASVLGRNVLDETGLTGQYEVKLEWAPDVGPISEEQRADLSAAVERRSIFSAVQEQLGLKLEPRKGKVQFFVIDGAEKPGEN